MSATMADFPSNDVIRTQIVRMYADFVSEVDPKGTIMDFLIQEEILTFELKDKILAETTRQDRCRRLLDELLASSSPRAFVVLRQALEFEKKWIVERIDNINLPRTSSASRNVNVDNSKKKEDPEPPSETEWMKQENDSLKKELQALKDESKKTEDSEVRSELETTKKENEFLKNQLQALQESTKKTDVSELRNELEAMKQENDSLMKQLEACQGCIDPIKKPDSELQRQLEETKKEVESLKKTLHTIRSMYPSLKAKRNLVIVGDGATGKTCLLLKFTTGQFPCVYVPTVFDNFQVATDVDGIQVDLTLFDTAGQEDYDRLRPLSFVDIDICLLCYEVSDPDSLYQITKKWFPEVRHFLPKTPIVLVANKADLRSSVDRARKGVVPVEAQEGQRVADEIGAIAYYETSALTGEGVREAFHSAIRLTLNDDHLKPDTNEKPLRRKVCIVQ